MRTHPLAIAIAITAAVLGLSSASCLSSCFGQTIGEGAARLTVRQAGALSALVSADERCGFASEAAIGAEVLEGEPGGRGRLIRRVEGCAFDVVALPLLGCDTETRVSGRFVVDAVRTIEGTLTGRADSPLLPAGPDAASIALTARVEVLEVVAVGDDNVMTQTGGVVSFTAHPRLAANDDSGACSVPTSHVRFAPLTLEGARLAIDTADLDVQIDVARADLDATNGSVGEQTNAVAGTMVIDGASVTIARELVEGFDAAAFDEAFSCNEGLALPVDFDCATPKGLVGPGAMRLAVGGLAGLVSRLQEDDACGFAARGPVSIVADDDSGRTGTVTWRAEGCSLASGAGAGEMVVTARKVVRGRLTGDEGTPVIPEDSDAVSLVVEDARGTLLIETAGAGMLIENAALSGSVRPRLAVGKVGICDAVTPHAEIEVAIAHADATLRSGALALPAVLDGLQARAVNGRIGSEENSIEGAVLVDGALVRTTGALDDDYRRAAFEAEVDALDKVAAPARFECDPRPFIALNAARLLVKNAGDFAGRIGDDTECGFGGGLGALLSPDQVEEIGGGVSLATFSTQACVPQKVATTNCVDELHEPLGDVSIDGALAVRGTRVPFTSVVQPNAPDATRLDMARVLLDGAGARSFDASGAPGSAHLTATGPISLVVEPRLAEGAFGIFDQGTPVAHIEMSGERLDVVLHVTANGANITLPVVVEDVRLRAANGPVDGTENAIAGSLVVDGLRVEVPEGTKLDPSYTRAAFEASYACDGVEALE